MWVNADRAWGREDVDGEGLVVLARVGFCQRVPGEEEKRGVIAYFSIAVTLSVQVGLQDAFSYNMDEFL